MKTSNRLLLGLLIVIFIIMVVNTFLLRNFVDKKIINNPEHKIELKQE